MRADRFILRLYQTKTKYIRRNVRRATFIVKMAHHRCIGCKVLSLYASKSPTPAYTSLLRVAYRGRSSSIRRLLEVCCCRRCSIASRRRDRSEVSRCSYETWTSSSRLSSLTSCCWCSLTWRWWNVWESCLARWRSLARRLILWGGTRIAEGLGRASTNRVAGNLIALLEVVVVWWRVVVAARTCCPVTSWRVLGGTWSTRPNVAAATWILLWGRRLSS